MKKRNNKETGFIYLLSDPITGEVRYIGKTIQFIDTRLKQHLYTAKRGSNIHLYKWIRKLLNNNSEPTIEILEEISSNQLNKCEIFYIDSAKKQKFNLVNGTGGGDGVCNPTSDVLLRMSESQRNRLPASEETRRKMSHPGNLHSMWGKHHSKESKEKMRLAKLGKKHTEEHIKKVSNSKKGKHLSEETKKKISESHKGLTHTEDTKRKLSIINTGKIISLETRDKLSKTSTGRPGFWKGKHLSEETKKKMSKVRKGKYHGKKTHGLQPA